MAHNPTWHAEYRRLETAAAAASTAFHAARRALERKRPAANAQAIYDAALIAVRETGKARWDFEMAATTIIDSATLPVEAWAASLASSQGAR